MPSSHPPARAFMKAVWELERSRSTESIMKLFVQDATLDTVALPSPLVGLGPIEQFWKDYLGHFQQIATSFNHAIDTPATTIVEWHSDGALADGTPIHYRGITLLGWDGTQIKSFKAYYDSAAFVPEYEKHLKRAPRA